MQTTTCTEIDAVQVLSLQVDTNKPCATLAAFECVGGGQSALDCMASSNACGNQRQMLAPIQASIHTIYLGNSSNISIGNQVPNCTPLEFTSNPTLQICGNFFAFDTRGGITCCPQESGVTGTGGIFVDCGGTLTICPQYRASFGTMVTKSGNGMVNLPTRQVVWDSGLAITEWKLNLGDPALQILVRDSVCTSQAESQLFEVPIVDKDEHFSEYTLDWLATTKDYKIFCPFGIGLFNPCMCPPVTCANINALPTVLGTVDQLNIKGSRLGDPAHIMVDGGLVREFAYISCGYPLETATSVLVLQHDGAVGLGSNHRNFDSSYASVLLGLNGVSIIANGDGTVFLNEDVTIDNLCQFLKGPDFDGNTLTIKSNGPRTLRVKATGTLDLSQFVAGDTVQLAGDVQLVLEPGAKIIFAGLTAVQACTAPQPMGGTLLLTDNASIILDPVLNPALLTTIPSDPSCSSQRVSVTNTDEVRVKLMGNGTIALAGCSQFSVPDNAYLGVETSGANVDNCSVVCTNITLQLFDNAQFIIGDRCMQTGGAFQIGNTAPHKFICGEVTQKDACVSFTLDLEGENAAFVNGTQGFLGFGVGIADKTAAAPNGWLVDTLFNVVAINLNIPNGTFKHERIFSGDDPRASLLAFADDPTTQYTLVTTPIVVDPYNPNEPLNTIDISATTILGGGNMALIAPGSGAIYPIVRCYDGVMWDRLTVSLLASSPIFQAGPEFPGGTGADLFEYLRTPEIPTLFATDGTPIASVVGDGDTAESDLHNNIRVGYIDNCLIGRDYVVVISGEADWTTKQKHAIDAGAVPILISGTPPTICPSEDPCSLMCTTTGAQPRPVVAVLAYIGSTR